MLKNVAINHRSLQFIFPMWLMYSSLFQMNEWEISLCDTCLLWYHWHLQALIQICFNIFAFKNKILELSRPRLWCFITTKARGLLIYIIGSWAFYVAEIPLRYMYDDFACFMLMHPNSCTMYFFNAHINHCFIYLLKCVKISLSWKNM